MQTIPQRFMVVFSIIALTLGSLTISAQAYDRPTTIAASRLEENARKLHRSYEKEVGRHPRGWEAATLAAVCDLSMAAPDLADDIKDDVPLNSRRSSFRAVDDAMCRLDRMHCRHHMSAESRELWERTRTAWKQVSARIRG